MLEIIKPSKFVLDEKTREWSRNAFYCQSEFWIDSVGDDNSACYVTKSDQETIAYSFVKYKKFPFGLGKIVVIERGPVVKNLQALEKHLQQIAQMKNLIQIEVSPYNVDISQKDTEETLIRNGWYPRSFQRAIYTHTVLVDLSPSEEDIRKTLRRSLKTQLNKAKKLELDIRVNTKIEEAIEFHNQFASQQGIAGISEQEKSFLLNSITQNKKYSQVLTAWKDEKLIGAIILIGMGDTILYQWGVSHRGEVYRKLPITHLLHWEAICLVKKLGYQFYDFGGYWNEKGDSNPINRFKTGFSKNIQCLTGEYFFRVKRFRSWLYEMIIKRNN